MADERVAYGVVAKVMATAQSQGANQLSFVTLPRWSRLTRSIQVRQAHQQTTAPTEEWAVGKGLGKGGAKAGRALVGGELPPAITQLERQLFAVAVATHHIHHPTVARALAQDVGGRPQIVATGTQDVAVFVFTLRERHISSIHKQARLTR